MKKTLQAAVATLGALVLGLGTLNAAQAEENPQRDYTYRAVDTVGVEGFNRGMIISDEVFYNPNTMSLQQIDHFIKTAGSACVPGKDIDPKTNQEVPIPCLKDFRQDTPTRPADAQCVKDYQGQAGETAAQIIYKVSQACQINPQSLLVLLQKEQSLLTASGAYLKNRRYAAATGMGCPDTAACDERYAGFFNQVYQAANRFHYYRLHPEKFRHRAGRMNDLLFSPKRDEANNYKCGSIRVFIENQATAGLYNYTPYTPNDAALRAGGDMGDECSSYGNRNFYRFFKAWFGSTGTAAAIPTGRLSGTDRVTTAAMVAERAYPGPADRVYLARADQPVDALVGGTLSDGPVLLVPVDRPIPQIVRDVINRRSARTVVALGGQNAIPDSVLADAAGSRATRRIFGPDRYSTAISISHEAYPGKVDVVYVADGIGKDGNGSPDAVVGGTLKDGPVLLLNPADPTSVLQVADEVGRFRPNKVIFLGGTSVINPAVASQVAENLPQERLAGRDRYDTSVAIARRVFPPQPRRERNGSLLTNTVLYIARGDNFADALVGGGLSDGPLLLARPLSEASPAAVQYTSELLPQQVIALGGPKAVHSDVTDSFVKALKKGL